MIPRLYIESPYAATDEYTVEDNVKFALAICAFAVDIGYAPFASHLFYTQFLDEETDRELGIHLGWIWGKLADEVWLCRRSTDQKFSKGVSEAWNHWLGVDQPVPIVKEMIFDVLADGRAVRLTRSRVLKFGVKVG